ncbi:MAG: 4-hydroxy-3-methylbut-2-en-1-yl diphosphate synthase [Treponema sp.]|nr:4-hydroxy-3-methylbut-2-en-1-yl diphosphate synthase [Treponema sp.]
MQVKTFGSQWKERVKNGETVLGGHIFLPNPAMAEAMVAFGYEYIWIDGEHGSFDKGEILNHIVAINGAGGGAFVRVVAGEACFIKPVAEMGPDGIIFPMICTAREARHAVDACVYPPGGKRGFGPRRANRYGLIGDKEYLDSIDKTLVKIVQIEHKKAVENIDDILKVKGIDGIVIGPYDLSGSLDLLGQLKHPAVLDCCRKVIAGCKVRHIPCGASIGSGDDEYVKFWLEQKINFIFCGDDIGFVKTGTESAIKKVKTGIAEVSSKE